MTFEKNKRTSQCDFHMIFRTRSILAMINNLKLKRNSRSHDFSRSMIFQSNAMMVISRCVSVPALIHRCPCFRWIIGRLRGEHVDVAVHSGHGNVKLAAIREIVSKNHRVAVLANVDLLRTSRGTIDNVQMSIKRNNKKLQALLAVRGNLGQHHRRVQFAVGLEREMREHFASVAAQRPDVALVRSNNNIKLTVAIHITNRCTMHRKSTHACLPDLLAVTVKHKHIRVEVSGNHLEISVSVQVLGRNMTLNLAHRDREAALHFTAVVNHIDEPKRSAENHLKMTVAFKINHIRRRENVCAELSDIGRQIEMQCPLDLHRV
eukprot:comp21891_c0_seq1/m.49654 comp21891_c0_seq1/g.49654  ORF comp21891_c0_seq1/g.49654 comp21891_c0_seq1/m.49654 type:complete len:320 (-) comp21891_c0_seq1:1120-2079(-)